jgi:hypothetical protein
MVELGQIKKPEIERFSSKRKLYCVPNVYLIKDAGDEYNELVDKYWGDVVQQIERLESAGKIKKIFYESIYTQGEEALNVLAKINEKAHIIVKKKVEEGAVLLPIESKEIFGTFLDWRNCLAVVRTEEVSIKVFEFYMEIYNKRLQHIQNTVESNMVEGEAGLLIMTDEDRIKLQFPADIEIFLVTPPSYDDLLRWFREKLKDLHEK